MLNLAHGKISTHYKGANNNKTKHDSIKALFWLKYFCIRKTNVLQGMSISTLPLYTILTSAE